ncbi:MAG: dipeptidase [Ktedonobacterales bacterium]
MSDLLPIFDGHNDTLLSLYLPARGGGRSFFARSERGHLDLPRARAGGLAGGFFAINPPPDMRGEMQPISDLAISDGCYEMRLAGPVNPDFALRFTLGALATLYRLERASEGQVKLVRTADELDACLDAFPDGPLAVVLHFEGAEMIGPDLDALYTFHAAGLRSLGPVWSRPNIFGDGVPFAWPRSPDTGPGLTVIGKELVKISNSLGVLLDLAHLNERGFWDVARLSAAPLVVTHAGAHARCPSTRNLTDRQLDAIGETNGVVGVIFDVSNIRSDGDDNADTPLEDIVGHIAYIADRIGVAHVALGSDFDGATMPAALGDASGLPKLIAALRAHGFDDAALRQIAYQNWARVLRQTWK